MKRRQRLFLIAILSLGSLTLAYFGNDWRIERQLNIARSALKSRDPDRALAALEAATQVSPNHGEVYLLMARAYRRQGRLSEVRRSLQTAQQLGITKGRIQREEWLAMAQTGQMTSAGPHLAELLFDPGDDGPEICEAYANGYLLSYRFAEAFAVVDAWQKDFPQDPQPHMFRGLVSDKDSAWTAAADHFQKAFDLAPNRIDIRLRLANALLALRRTPEAASHFQELLKRNPHSREAQTGWGRTLVEQGQTDQARDVFSDLLKTHADDFDTILALGQLELSVNNLDRALTLLQQATKLNPDDYEARNSIAGALQRAGRAAEARSHFEFVVKAQESNLRIQTLKDRVTANSNDLEARYELTELLRNNGSQTDRVAWLRSIIEIDPKHQRAQAALAEHYEQTGDSELAVTHRAFSEALQGNSMPKVNSTQK